MNFIPVILFGIAAIGGLILATLYFKNMNLPAFLIMGHGILAAAGLTTLALIVYENPGNIKANISLTLFVAAAIGGFSMFSFTLRKKTIPGFMIPIHGLAAVIAFLLLLLAVLK